MSEIGHEKSWNLYCCIFVFYFCCLYKDCQNSRSLLNVQRIGILLVSCVRGYLETFSLCSILLAPLLAMNIRVINRGGAQRFSGIVYWPWPYLDCMWHQWTHAMCPHPFFLSTFSPGLIVFSLCWEVERLTDIICCMSILEDSFLCEFLSASAFHQF